VVYGIFVAFHARAPCYQERGSLLSYKHSRMEKCIKCLAASTSRPEYGPKGDPHRQLWRKRSNLDNLRLYQPLVPHTAIYSQAQITMLRRDYRSNPYSPCKLCGNTLGFDQVYDIWQALRWHG
jgi:hypothetical protein